MLTDTEEIQIKDDYHQAISEFLNRMKEIDRKYHTYARLEFRDVEVSVLGDFYRKYIREMRVEGINIGK